MLLLGMVYAVPADADAAPGAPGGAAAVSSRSPP